MRRRLQAREAIAAERLEDRRPATAEHELGERLAGRRREVTPSIPWPVLTNAFEKPGRRSITGRPSGSSGRPPTQGSRIAPISSSGCSYQRPR
jgi:hypothetical protein